MKNSLTINIRVGYVLVLYNFCLKNGFNRIAKNDFENAFPRIQSNAHLKNSRHAQFNCLERYQKNFKQQRKSQIRLEQVIQDA